MANKKAMWLVRRASDGRILCTDGLWRNNAGCVEHIKFYTSANRAHRYGLRHRDGSLYPAYDGDRVDCCGRISHNRLADCGNHVEHNTEPESIGAESSSYRIETFDCEAHRG